MVKELALINQEKIRSETFSCMPVSGDDGDAISHPTAATKRSVHRSLIQVLTANYIA